jgi:hypothetical protein
MAGNPPDQPLLAPDRLPPHPLVVGLTARGAKDAGAVIASRQALRVAEERSIFKDLETASDQQLKDAQAEETKARSGTQEAQDAAKERRKLAERDNNALTAPLDAVENQAIDKFSADGQARQFILVAGYLGGCVQDNSGDNVVRQVLFVTPKLASWVLVPLEKISLFSRVKDDSAAFGLRDILWLEPDVRVVRGEDSDSVSRSYLNGPFIRVDEFAASVRSTTMARASSGSLLDEALTPTCCPKTQRP